ncbi:MAG TPA: hypothetical protein PLZ52_09480 [Bacteroidales bacterium]|nr:hypothetical protein [Bacteroidales bacterium]HOE05437.1 hypothetical protein [Bacteroidales bacterium]
MNADYICPKCGGYLKVKHHIILLTKNSKGDSALVLLSPEVGDYSFKIHPSVKIADGEHTNFICPICYENLNSEDLDKNLARLTRIDENGHKSDVVFSQIKGEKCTFKITEHGIEAYGDHTENYLNHFGLQSE